MTRRFVCGGVARTGPACLLVLVMLLFTAGFAWGQTEDPFGQSSSRSTGGQQAPRQDSEQDAAELAEEAQARLAMATPDYPVTPGDVYQLSFVRSTGSITQTLVVESDFSISLSVLGDFDAAGLTFTEARRQIEERVREAYPGSAPNVVIERLGRFHILVKGEVQEARLVTATGLTRLDEVVEDHRTSYASVRRVEVVSRGGEAHSYDLFRARRDGEIAENPYVRPGDQVVLSAAERRVRIEGEVRRPGTYQLLEGEGIEELIARYADGFTGRALPDRVRIVSLGAGPSQPTETAYADLSEGAAPSVRLEDGDRVVVPTKLSLRPVVYFEGALSDAPYDASPPPVEYETQVESEETEDARDDPDLQTARAYRAGRVSYRFEPGERLSSAVSELQSRFLPTSNLENAMLSREGQGAPQPVDLAALLRGEMQGDVRLQSGDRITIPYEEFFVTVSGSVNAPGRYDYVPGRTYEYYLSLAGGVDRGQHWFGVNPRIRSKDGERRPKSAEIQPEDRIHFRANNPFRIITPVVTTVGAVLSAIITVQNLSN